MLVWIYLILINSKYHLSLIKFLNDRMVDANGQLCERGCLDEHALTQYRDGCAMR